MIPTPMDRFITRALAGFAFVAAAALALALFGVGHPLDGHTLHLCVEWFNGFTGHVDGLALLAGAPMVGAVAGATGSTTSDPPGTAGDGAAGEPAIDYDELARAYFEQQALAQHAERNAAGGAAGTAAPVALNADAGVAPGETRQEGGAGTLAVDERGAVVGYDHANAWQRRAARYIRATVLFGTGDVNAVAEASRAIGDLTVFTLDQRERDFEAEYREALETIALSNLDGRAKARCRMLLGQYHLDLRALRGVPAERRRSYSPLAPDDTQGGAGRRTMSTLSDTAGGYLVPEPMLAELLVIIEEYGYARDFFRVIPMTSKSLKWTEIGTKPTAAWYGELELIAASDMAFAPGELSTSKLAGITSLSRELDEDSLVAILPVYIQLMGEAMAQKEDLAAIKGDGTSTYGGFVGVLNLTGVNGTTTMGSGKDTFAEFDIDEAINVLFALPKSLRRNASWLLPEAAVKGLLLLKRNNEANNFAIIQNPQDPASIDKLLGYPVIGGGVEDSFFPSSAASTVFGAFGDFRRSLFGVRRGLTVEQSRDGVLSNSSGVVTLNAFQQDAILAKVTERVAIGHPQPQAYQLIKTAA